jgi:hypothetical protein
VADGDHLPERRTDATRPTLRGPTTVLGEDRAIGRKIGTGLERPACLDSF